MSKASEFVACLLIKRFDAAVFGDDAASADEGDTNSTPHWQNLRRGQNNTKRSRESHAGIDFEQFLQMRFRVVLSIYAGAGGETHPFDQAWLARNRYSIEHAR